ncbi:MAG: DUF3791 domain-containing protein [Ruminococcus sp.]|nr:DUF3791 domain-containing protein [Ruminococcus sp.]
MLTKEMEFFIFLLEQYACYKNRPTSEVLKEWDEHKIAKEIYDNYLTYHQEALENAYDDIDSLLLTGKHIY